MATINYNGMVLKKSIISTARIWGVYYSKADVDKLIESLKADHNIELPDVWSQT